MATLTLVLTAVGGPAPAGAAGPSAQLSARTGTLTGQVSAWTGSFRPDLPAGVAITVVAASTGRTVATSVTGDLGVIQVTGVPAGRVQVHASLDRFLPTWAPRTPRRSEGMIFVVSAGQVTDVGGVEIFLPASVGGHVVDTAGKRIPFATVTVYRIGDGKPEASGITDAGGAYAIGNLYPDGMKMRASLKGYIPNWFDSVSQRTWTTADPMGVAPGICDCEEGTDSTHLVLAREGMVKGKVLGRGRPLAHATVTVFDALTDLAMGRATTNRSGSYAVHQLSVWGGRQVLVRASKAGWRSEWANGEPSRNSSLAFPLNPGDVLGPSSTPPVATFTLSHK